jgi:hypothetical protein
MGEFVSPQTGSVYNVFWEDKGVIVCYRKLNENCSRVRIQNNTGILPQVQEKLLWGDVKGGDHLSVICKHEKLPKAICIALRAVLEVVGV